MSSINIAALSKTQLVEVLTALIEGEVAQAPTEVKAEAKTKAKPRCAAITASTGDRCLRNATQGDVCKSHVDWDNDEALAKHAKGQEFVGFLRERAQGKEGKAGKAPKVNNKALAAAMRAEGLTPNGDAWAAAKALVAKGETLEAAAKAVATK